MEKATAVNTCLGVLMGRDCIYLDQVKQDALNNLTVKAGDKKLNLPTVEGGKVEAYADYEQIIDTDGTIYQPLEDKTVSVEFKVTDQAVTKQANGIVQGMSGSPIIQNDKIIGCVTHVSGNNPMLGYGLYIESGRGTDRCRGGDPGC